MKSNLLKTALFTITLLFLASCSKKDDNNNPQVERATAAAFNALKTAAIQNKTQNFQIDLNQTNVITTENGAQFVIDGSCITNNGNATSGTADITIVELFGSSEMATTGITTMGEMANGDRALLISGGAFFVNATQNGIQLQLDCAIQATIPTNLTGGSDTDMLLWKGINGVDEDCDLPQICENVVWEEIENEDVAVQQGDDGETYYVADFGDFGWTNVDKFFLDSRPKTSLLVDVPNGFDNSNCKVYIYYNGQPNALGELDTYIEDQQLFSEHYGQIPIGLECHIVFASEDNGNWLYALKPATIEDGGIITISDSDLDTATASELETLINNLP